MNTWRASEDRRAGWTGARRTGGASSAVRRPAADRGGADRGDGLDAAASARRRRERVIQIGAAKRTATVQVYIGKSEDVRTDTSFVDIMVGDPEVADVNPLTDRTLSILGKKNGTTRVSVYAEGKKLIGVFDVEVVYDTSLVAVRDQRSASRTPS